MIAEPCPTCKGFCCGDGAEAGIRYEHLFSETMTHECAACSDGTSPAPRRTALDERNDVLAWLRDVGTSAAMSADEMVTLHWVARAIFGKEHVGYAKKEKP